MTFEAVVSILQHKLPLKKDWSWIACRLARLMDEYPLGLSETIISSEMDKADTAADIREFSATTIGPHFALVTLACQINGDNYVQLGQDETNHLLVPTKYLPFLSLIINVRYVTLEHYKILSCW